MEINIICDDPKLKDKVDLFLEVYKIHGEGSARAYVRGKAVEIGPDYECMLSWIEKRKDANKTADLTMLAEHRSRLVLEGVEYIVEIADSRRGDPEDEIHVY